MEMQVYIEFFIIFILITLLVKSEYWSFIFFKNYLSFLFVRWKLITFIVAVIGLSFLSTIVGDPTWDIPVSIVMGILTFITSPFSVFCLYKSIKARAFNLDTAIALLLSSISAGFSYDLYNYFLSGFIPDSWFENFVLSSIIYFAAGLFWNLEGHQEYYFSFLREDYPVKYYDITFKVFIRVLVPAMIVVASFFCSFYFF